MFFSGRLEMGGVSVFSCQSVYKKLNLEIYHSVFSRTAGLLLGV
jgi:hypothetical protein